MLSRWIECIDQWFLGNLSILINFWPFFSWVIRIHFIDFSLHFICYLLLTNDLFTFTLTWTLFTLQIWFQSYFHRLIPAIDHSCWSEVIIDCQTQLRLLLKLSFTLLETQILNANNQIKCIHPHFPLNFISSQKHIFTLFCAQNERLSSLLGTLQPRLI